MDIQYPLIISFDRQTPTIFVERAEFSFESSLVFNPVAMNMQMIDKLYH